MKSEHRHELETNWLAKQLDIWIEQWKPYAGTVLGAIAVAVAAIVGWTLYNGSTASQQTEAWNAYNNAVVGMRPDIEALRESAEEFPGSKMKELADITWADGQVWMATREYIYLRSGALEALDRAQSAYEGVIRTTSDPRLENRARLGLARIYEMRNELDKAKDEYGRVEGAFAPIAKMRAERLAEPDVKATYDWLATAQPPRPRAPLGPGTPGQTPEFSVGDMTLPGGTTGAAGVPAAPGTSLDTLFENLDLQPQDATTEQNNEADEAPPPADDDTSTSDAPSEPAATSESSTNEPPAPADNAPAENAPSDSAPSDVAPSDSAPSESAPSEKPAE